MTVRIRQGLPRRPGGEPWPPVAEGEPDVIHYNSVESTTEALAVEIAAEATADAAAVSPGDPSLLEAVPSVGERASAHHRAVSLRRGLPRLPGGEPWPPAGGAEGVETRRTQTSEQPGVALVEQAPAVVVESTPRPAPEPIASITGDSASTRMSDTPTGIRRGLPRVRRGIPWPDGVFLPPVVTAVPAAAIPASTDLTGAAVVSEPVDLASTPLVGVPSPATNSVLASSVRASTTQEPARRTNAPSESSSKPVQAAAGVGDICPISAPSLSTRPATSVVAKKREKAEFEFQGLSIKQWAGASLVGGVLLVAILGSIVGLARWFLGIDFMQDFIGRYPGESHLPESAPVGVPAWLGWQHFFNLFLMIMIIRSGWLVRKQQRPDAYWTPRRSKNGEGKISLNLWLHQSLDVLWLVNGAVFVVLLFATGQWMKVVPTSWDIFPNMVSAALQYISLDWPTENGWVHYNALQVMAYFITIFIAAPLAVVTGFRMSAVWPKKAKKLSRIYPIEWARAVHFPVMLYFVGFIVIHVTLVFATGALRNLNHMYAARGSADPTAYAGDWTGFWMFLGSMAIVTIVWVASRPMVLTPIAGLFGKVRR